MMCIRVAQHKRTIDHTDTTSINERNLQLGKGGNDKNLGYPKTRKGQLRQESKRVQTKQ